MNYIEIAHEVRIYEPEKWNRDTEIKGILFDMDGLVLDTEVLYTRFWQEAAWALGYPMTREQALGMRSLSRNLASEKLNLYFGKNVDYEGMRQKRIELMSAYIEKEGVQPKPGIKELLAYLKEKGIKTAIATSSPLDRTEQYLRTVELEHAFDKLISGYMVKKGKPEPDIYLLAAKELGLPPGHCLALEDSPSGLISASRAGCLPVMIPDQDEPTEETKRLLFAKAGRLDRVIDLLEWMRNERNFIFSEKNGVPTSDFTAET